VVRRLVDGDAASSVFVGFLGFLNNLDLEFYDSRCLTLLHAHNYAYIMPVVRWGKTIRQELSEGWNRVIQHSLTVSVLGVRGDAPLRRASPLGVVV
jgi:hypothetical protein